ncbi:hypothetical protein [Paenibacillus sp. 22594]|uniref:hypothetical protein n=1 Tax=Paenibacillus sp. 22594 TaxID=3453947 RepID=UPI003F85B7BF
MKMNLSKFNAMQISAFSDFILSAIKNKIPLHPGSYSPLVQYFPRNIRTGQACLSKSIYALMPVDDYDFSKKMTVSQEHSYSLLRLPPRCFLSRYAAIYG